MKGDILRQRVSFAGERSSFNGKLHDAFNNNGTSSKALNHKVHENSINEVGIEEQVKNNEKMVENGNGYHNSRQTYLRESANGTDAADDGTCGKVAGKRCLQITSAF